MDQFKQFINKCSFDYLNYFKELLIKAKNDKVN